MYVSFCRASFVAFLLLLVSPLAQAQQREIARDAEANVSSFIEEWLKEKPSAGVSVAYSYGAKTFAKGFGFRDLKKRLPATPKTTYRMASVTKSFTAVVAMRLALEKRLNLDAPIQKYVPYYPKKRHKVTPRHLLGHLSGIPHYVDCRKECHIKEEYSTKQSIELFKDFKLRQKPGDAYMYTSYGYNLLGAALEKAGRASYATLLKRHVFSKANMKQSALDTQRSRGKQRAKGYRVNTRGQVVASEKIDVTSRFAGGGTRSTVLDMLRFGKGLLNDTFLPKDVVAEMFDSMQTNEGMLTDYGMGFGTYPQGGRWVAAHTGGQPETTTMLAIYPGDDLVIAIATNLEGQGALVRAITEKIASELLAGGDQRRRPRAKTREADAFTGGIYKTASHGIARARYFGFDRSAPWSHTFDAMNALNALLSFDYISQNIDEAELKVDLGDDPLGGSVFPKAGVFMAQVIRNHQGERALTNMVQRSPFAFFLAYNKAHKALALPASLALSNELIKSAQKMHEEYSVANNKKIRQLSLSKDSTATLEKSFAKHSVLPDFSKELDALSAMYFRKSADDPASKKHAKSLSHFSAKHYPRSKHAALSEANAFAFSNNEKGVYTALERYLQIDKRPLEKRMQSLRFRALALKKISPEAAVIFLKAYTRRVDNDVRALDELSRVSEKIGERESALEAAQKAFDLAPNKRRKKRLSGLQ